ncbi:MAG: glutamine amidotransferase-related protein, partial [Gemmatimonadales bacterium]
MILLIDNYDSFVYNLARYVRELGEVPLVRRHDAVTVDEIEALGPS